MKPFTSCTHEEDSLLNLFRSGNSEAFNKVYHLFAPSLLYTARSIVKDEHEAEDIVVDAFQKCWNKKDCFATLQKMKCYLYVVVKHAGYHYVERLKNRDHIYKEIGYLHDERDSYALEHMLRREMLSQVYGLMENLPGKSADVLKMLYVKEFSTHQIAQVMQMPVEHVRVVKSRALRYLRQAMSQRALL